MFRYASNVVNVHEVPTGITAVLTGHIHRFQVLQKDLSGNPLSVSVLYPGSTERTSFAERDEAKGYLIVEIDTDSLPEQALNKWTFYRLPTRPMIQRDITVDNITIDSLRDLLLREFMSLPKDSVVKIKLFGEINRKALPLLTASSIRKIAPETMNVEIVPVDYVKRRSTMN